MSCLEGDEKSPTEPDAMNDALDTRRIPPIVLEMRTVFVLPPTAIAITLRLIVPRAEKLIIQGHFLKARRQNDLQNTKIGPCCGGATWWSLVASCMRWPGK